MELTVAVCFLGDLAHYAISRESQGIYLARLLRYEGPDGVTPPESLTLVRGTRHWVGSYDEAWFVAALGRALEETIEGTPAPQKEDTAALDEQA